MREEPSRAPALVLMASGPAVLLGLLASDGGDFPPGDVLRAIGLAILSWALGLAWFAILTARRRARAHNARPASSPHDRGGAMERARGSP